MSGIINLSNKRNSGVANEWSVVKGSTTQAGNASGSKYARGGGIEVMRPSLRRRLSRAGLRLKVAKASFLSEVMPKSIEIQRDGC